MRQRLLESRPLAGRLSVGAIGLGLVLMVGAAWVTGVFYLVARLGASSPVGLGRMDGVHIYVGVVGGVFVVAKVLRVGLHRSVPGVPSVLLWQRWISWSLLVLYAAILLSGVLLLLPIRGSLYGSFVEVHLLASTWALAPTTWHVWHYRHRALPYLLRWHRSRRLRFWLGLGLVAPAAVVLLFEPRAATQLPQIQGGSSWSRAALPGSYLDTITTTGDGSTLVAGGDNGVYFSRDGVLWLGIGLPASGGSSNTQTVESVAPAGGGLFAGTTDGLFYARTLQGPLARVALGGRVVWAVAVDPADARSLAVASSAGPMLSDDGGRTWRAVSAGMARPELATAIEYFRGHLFASDTSAVYELAPGADGWRRVSSQALVLQLTVSTDGKALYATSPTQAVQVLDAGTGRWTPLAPPAPAHQHQGGGHVHSQLGGVLALGDRLYVPGTSEGVAASPDAGNTWTQLGGGNIAGAAPAQLTEFQGALWAATANGVYRYQLTPERPPSVAWWIGLFAAALGCGLLATLIGAPERRRRD